MAATDVKGDLARRIKAEFDARDARRQTAEKEQAKAAGERERRLAQFTKVCEDLRAVWRPRLEEFSRQFGDRIKVTPTMTPEQRHAKVNFITDLANVTLTLSASASSDVSKLVLDYDLLILPIFFEYERHARAEFPLDKIDPDAIGSWIDDRLMTCVKAYFSMLDNEYYIKGAMVEDPITKAKFLKEEAKAKCDQGGRTYYFNSEDSLRQFQAKHKPAADAAAARPDAKATSKAPAAEPKPTKADAPAAST